MDPNPDPNDTIFPQAPSDPHQAPDYPQTGDEPAPSKEPGQVAAPTIQSGPGDDLVTSPGPVATMTTTEQPAAKSDGLSVGTVLPWALVVVLLVALGGVLVLRRRPAAPAPAPVPPVAPAPDLAASAVVPELITLADLITTPAAQTQVVRTLRAVGVEPIDAVVGARFDPEVHEAVATRPAEHPTQTGTIAVVHRAGWRSAHGVVRPAGVEIWVADPKES